MVEIGQRFPEMVLPKLQGREVVPHGGVVGVGPAEFVQDPPGFLIVSGPKVLIGFRKERPWPGRSVRGTRREKESRKKARRGGGNPGAGIATEPGSDR